MIMSRSKSLLAAAVLGTVAFAGASQAATVTITPVVSRYFANQTDALAATASPSTANNRKPGIYEIAYKVSTALTATDTTAGFSGFGNVFFDAIPQGAATLPTHLSINSDFGSNIVDLGMKYNNAFTRFTYNDPITGAQITNGAGTAANNNLYATVGDLGTAGDYKSLVAEISAAANTSGSDPRSTATQSSQPSAYTNTPFGSATAGDNGLIGNPPTIFTMYVNFDGLATTTLQGSANPATEGFGLRNNTTGGTTFFPAGTPSQSLVISPLVLTVPEPTSLGLLGLGSLVALRRRRA